MGMGGREESRCDAETESIVANLREGGEEGEWGMG